MNNVSFGGADPRRGNEPFTYYETIAGGCGASARHAGPSAVHSHMTNSWNTPTEVFEEAYPARVKRYAIRRNSGGAGRNRGGDGIVRELEFLTAVEVGLLTDRRNTSPYGLAGGRPGQPGRNVLRRGASVQTLAGKCAFRAEPGDTLHIETPGGGGWGPLPSRKGKPAAKRKRSR